MRRRFRALLRRTLLATEGLARGLAWLGLGLAAWTLLASLLFLWLADLLTHPSIPAWSRPWMFWVYVRYFEQDLMESLNLCIAAVVASTPVVALGRWQFRRLGGLAGITHRTLHIDRIRRGSTLNHGTADWMEPEKVSELFPSTPDPELGGVVVGEMERVDLSPVAKLRFNPQHRETWSKRGRAPLMIDPCQWGSTHSLVIGGAGAFKSTALTTTLLTWRKSQVVLDPAGELADKVGAALRAKGQKVVTLDIGAQGPNVLDAIDIRDEEMAEARLRSLAGRIIGPMPTDETGNAGRFKRWGRAIVIALLADLVWRQDIPAELKTLRALRDGLDAPSDLMKARLRGIYEKSPSPLARSMAASVMDMPAETWGGALGNATDDTEWLASERYADLVSGGGFNLREIVQGNVVVFVQVPQEILQATPSMARVLIGSMLDAVFAAKGKVDGRVLFALDEAVLLGAEPSLKVARDQGRKFKVTLQLLYQSEGQIEEVWGRHGRDAWFDSVSWRQYTSVQNVNTARDISVALGTYGAVQTSQGRSDGSSGKFLETPNSSRGQSTNEQEIPRDVAKTHELLQEFRADERITLVRGARPIRHAAAIDFCRPEIKAQLGSSDYQPGGRRELEPAESNTV